MNVLRKTKHPLKYKFGFLFLMLSFVTVHFYIPKFIVEPNNSTIHLIKLLKDNKTHNNSSKTANVSHVNTEGFTIKGRYNLSNEYRPNLGTIILIHGIRGNKTYFQKLATKLNLNGYNTFAIDLRAHGESSGKYCTFGAKEKYDVKLAIDYLKQEFSISDFIGVWGQSLGGSVALQAMANDTRIQFGIIESTYASYETITHEYIKRLVGFDLSCFTSYLTKRAATIASFTLIDANTTIACKKITQPVLIAHGTKDIHIPIQYGKMNYEALSSKNKIFLAIEGADHINLWQKGGESYFKNVIGFINEIH